MRTIASGLLVMALVAACGGDDDVENAAASSGLNTLDRSKLGDACDATTTCPSGYGCASITVNEGDRVSPTCVKQDGCPLTCVSGSSCVTMGSYPAQIACARD